MPHTSALLRGAAVACSAAALLALAPATADAQDASAAPHDAPAPAHAPSATPSALRLRPPALPLPLDVPDAVAQRKRRTGDRAGRNTSGARRKKKIRRKKRKSYDSGYALGASLQLARATNDDAVYNSMLGARIFFAPSLPLKSRTLSDGWYWAPGGTIDYMRMEGERVTHGRIGLGPQLGVGYAWSRTKNSDLPLVRVGAYSAAMVWDVDGTLPSSGTAYGLRAGLHVDFSGYVLDAWSDTLAPKSKNRVTNATLFAGGFVVGLIMFSISHLEVYVEQMELDDGSNVTAYGAGVLGFGF